MRAETVSGVVEGRLVTVEMEVTGRHGVVDSEEVEGTEIVLGGSVMLLGDVGSSVEESPVLWVDILSAVLLVGVSAVCSSEQTHTSVSAGVTVLEGETVTQAESETEFEIVGRKGAVASVRAGVAEAGLSLAGVLDSASCIWVSSFSGVLRPDAAGGGPGLTTGFGRRAGFPAASCADTLVRI